MSSQSTQSETTTYCFRCQYHPGPDDGPLKRCARCRSRHYCSRDCQRNDWPRHKEECGTLAAGGQVTPRTRTTMRFRSIFGVGAGAQPDLETIYHLRTSKPHIKDISMSGPYFPVEAVVEQVRHRLTVEGCMEGLQTFDDIVGAGQLSDLMHLNASMRDGNIIKFELLPEKNAEVARAWPRQVWKVLVATPDLTNFPNRTNRGQQTSQDHPPTKDMEVHKTFTTKEAAIRDAQQVLQALKADAANDALAQSTHLDRLPVVFESMVYSPRENTGQTVTVMYDSGEVARVDL